MTALGTIVRFVEQIGKCLLDFAIPWRCMLCGAVLPSNTQWHYLCRQCFDSLHPAPPPQQLLAIAQEHSGDLDDCPLSLVIARWSADPRQAGLFRLIYALKYYGYWQVGVELGIELGAAVQLLAPTRYDAIVPVPTIQHVGANVATTKPMPSLKGCSASSASLSCWMPFAAPDTRKAKPGSPQENAAPIPKEHSVKAPRQPGCKALQFCWLMTSSPQARRSAA